MWIHFSKAAYGSYGGDFAEPFCYLGRIIADKFQNSSMEFPYSEIEICLAIFTKKQQDNQQYKDWYNKLPLYYRGKYMIRVTLPVTKGKDTLSSIFQNIYNAFDIIVSKKKKTDNIDPQKVKQALTELENELQDSDMWEVNRKYEILYKKESVEQRIQERALREQANEEKKRLIYDIRFYYGFEDVGNLYFSPYDGRFCNKILEELRERKFRLPRYSHLYIMVSDTLENALYQSVRLEEWFVYGVAVYKDYKSFEMKRETEKKVIVFDLIRQGLNDIARIDKLDIEVLNEVLDKVEQHIFRRCNEVELRKYKKALPAN